MKKQNKSEYPKGILYQLTEQELIDMLEYCDVTPTPKLLKKVAAIIKEELYIHVGTWLGDRINEGTIRGEE